MCLDCRYALTANEQPLPLHAHTLLLDLLAALSCISLCMRVSERPMDKSQVLVLLKLQNQYDVRATTRLAGFLENLEG